MWTYWSAGGNCKLSHMRPAHEIKPGTEIVRVSPKLQTFQPVNVTNVTYGRTMVRYIVTAHGALIVNGVLR